MRSWSLRGHTHAHIRTVHTFEINPAAKTFFFGLQNYVTWIDRGGRRKKSGNGVKACNMQAHSMALDHSATREHKKSTHFYFVVWPSVAASSVWR